MVATTTLSPDFLGLQFWDNWNKKIYNTKTYDASKDDFLINESNSPNVDALDDNEFMDQPPTQISEDADDDQHNSTSILSNSVKYRRHFYYLNTRRDIFTQS